MMRKRQGKLGKTCRGQKVTQAWHIEGQDEGRGRVKRAQGQAGEARLEGWLGPEHRAWVSFWLQWELLQGF